MPYKSHIERERVQWLTLPEAVAHVRAVDGCNQDDARRQLLKALTDGALGALRWEDTRPTARIAGGTVPLDIPPGPDQHWECVEIDWQAGTVCDDWGEAGPRHRVLLIRGLRLSEHWRDMRPAGSAAAEDRAVGGSKARSKPGPKPVKRQQISAKMLDDLRSGKRKPEQLKKDTLVALAAAYGGSQNTANVARQDALARFSESQNSPPIKP